MIALFVLAFLLMIFASIIGFPIGYLASVGLVLVLALIGEIVS